jgi:hypothetical protein
MSKPQAKHATSVVNESYSERGHTITDLWC